VLRPGDTTNQEVRGFDDGEALQYVHNVDQILRDIEFQRVYTPSELARLKLFIEDSKKPLYPDCQKYSRLSGDLKLLQLKAYHGWSNKSFKHLFDVLRDMLPVRVAWYFCIIPRVRRWFATQKEAQLLRWHDEGRKELNYKKDGKFRHPADAAQWGNMNTHFPWFDDARSIHFAMSTDVVNPFGNQSSTHST
jgi:hypothetical protein